MSHLFGDLLTQHLHRKHGLSQAKLAEGILQDPSIIGKMCKGERLTGPQARERVLSIIGWLHEQGALKTAAEANTLLNAAGISALHTDEPAESALLQRLRPEPLSNDRPSAPPARRTNLPALLTSFVGRTHELDEVAQIIAAQRLVTLTGAGGVGKTRLATEVGIRLLQDAGADTFADGVWLVELAPLIEPTLVAQAIAQLFRLAEQADCTTLDVIEDYLTDKHLLLILDNCEHLVDACAEIAERLLPCCWQLRMLATSREELRIAGERVYPVLPLALPDPAEHTPERVLDCGAVQLFVERTGVVLPALNDQWRDVAAIAHICRQLDGIPLALELAAPLARNMTLSEITGQLHDQMAILRSSYRTAIPRHQTMQRALDWSYRLLAPAEQQLLARVSIFAGGWTLAAAQAVCANEPGDDLSARLEQLVTKSLALAESYSEQRRYRLLEPVRQFAYAQLVASGEEAETRQRHALYFLSLAEQMEQARDTTQEREWLQKLRAERDNLRAVNRWALEQREAGFAHRFNGSLFAFWIYCSSLAEAHYWLESALALQRDASTPAALAAEALALDAAGYVMVAQRDYIGARACFEREMTLHTEIGYQPRIATGMRGCGFTAMQRGDLVQAQHYVEGSLAVSRAAGDRWGAAWALYSLGYLAFVRGDLDQARALLEEALPELRDQSILFGTFRALFALGHVLRRQGETAQARTYYQDGLRIQQVMGYLQVTADGLEALAGIAAEERDAERTARLMGAADAHREAIAAPRWLHREAQFERDATLARSQLDPDAWHAAWEAGRAMTLDQAVEYALEE
jgi:predicted ATPase